MRVSKTGLFVLIFMIIFSIFAANVVNILNNEATYDNLNKFESTEQHLTLDDGFEHLIWFLQITDIHISIFRDPNRITQFKEFCDVTIDIIKPKVILASGDLTDAKTSNSIGSKQNENEWKQYRNILDTCNVTQKTTWLDIRGNHDNFNVAGAESRENFFPNYSIQGRRHPRSYMHQTHDNLPPSLTRRRLQPSLLYTFIGVDACLEPGPRRPFNFVGVLDTEEVVEIRRLIDRTRASGSNYTVWFGHFPTSCILTTSPEDGAAGGVRGLLRGLDQSMVYVCGHLHTLGGLVPQMYTLQKDGFLELELGDWKDNRRFRLMALDHGLLSFIDTNHGDWPLILITNPKHALFVIPGKENLEVIRKSSHIRILAFSIDRINLVKARVNNEKWQPCKHISGPLYVCEWNAMKYNRGLHSIQVVVKDDNGREKALSQPFSLDGSKLSFQLLPKIALMSNASTIFKVMFVILLIFSILPLCVLRIAHKFVKEGKMSKPTIRKGCGKSLLRKMWILSTVDRIFWPLVLYPIYLSFGPWSIGHIIEDHIGVIFAWGIFVNGTFLPGSFTYAYGFLQIFTFQIPLTVILSYGVDSRFQYNVIKPGKTKGHLGKICLHLPFAILLSLQIILAFFFWLAYGTLAFVLGPLRTWSIILALVLWYQTLNLPEKCTRNAALVWYVKPESNSLTDFNVHTTM